MRGATARKLRKQALERAELNVVDYQNERGQEALFGRVLTLEDGTGKHHKTERRIALPRQQQGTIRCHPYSPRGVYRQLKQGKL